MALGCLSAINCKNCVAPWCFHAGKDHLPCMSYVDNYETSTYDNSTVQKIRSNISKASGLKYIESSSTEAPRSTYSVPTYTTTNSSISRRILK